jgi:hypothetical protein
MANGILQTANGSKIDAFGDFICIFSLLYLPFTRSVSACQRVVKP